MKTCPDCAEQVLAAARKCRFCGYRFDGPESDRLDDTSLMSFLVRPRPRPTTVSAMVSRWGVELDDDEDPVEFVICKSDGEAGFALVTDSRLVLFVGSRDPLTVLVDQPLSVIDGVRAERRGLARRLLISWRGGSVTIDGLRRSDFDRLKSLLEAATRDL